MKTAAGKRVLVPGAAMGVGRLFAERAVSEGAADVVLWDVASPAELAYRIGGNPCVGIVRAGRLTERRST